MQTATMSFSEDLARHAIRQMLRAEFSPKVRLVSGMLATLAIVLAALSVIGLLDSIVAIGISSGIVIAGLFAASINLASYVQNRQFPLRVLRASHSHDVTYRAQQLGCSVSFGSQEVTLPWSDLVDQWHWRDYVMLKFRTTESFDQAKLQAIGAAMLAGSLGPDLLGFPVFCLLPTPKFRYLLVPNAIAQAAPSSRTTADAGANGS